MWSFIQRIFGLKARVSFEPYRDQVPTLREVLPPHIFKDTQTAIWMVRGDTLNIKTDDGGEIHLWCHTGPSNQDWLSARVIVQQIVVKFKE